MQSDLKQLHAHVGREVITLRAIAIGIVLLIFNVFWQTEIEFVRYSDSPTIPSLFFNCVAWLVILLTVNGALSRIAPRWRLSRAELLTIYAMLCIASQQASHDWLQILFSMLVYVHRFATPANRWDELIHPHLPKWLFVSDRDVLRALCEGGSTLYDPANWRAWLPPLSWWSLFAFAFSLGTLFVIALLRRQWDFERLTYPIAEIPLEMTHGKLWRNRGMWIGFAIGAAVRIINQLHYVYPSVPLIPVNIRYYRAQSRPWRAWGGFPVCFFPFSFGLSFLMPLDLSFSCWFFYLFTRSQLVLADAFGRYRWGGFPYMIQQCTGGYIGLGIITLWSAREWLWRIARHTVAKFQNHSARDADFELRDDDELMPYSVAIIGAVACAIFTLAFAVRAGMSFGIAIAYFIILWLIVLSVTRLRVEMGLPTNELFRAGADDILARVLGTDRIGARDLTAMSVFAWLMRTHRQFPMQTQADMTRIAHRSGMHLRSFARVVIATTAFSIPLVWWAFLHTMFRIGLQSAKVTGPALWAFGPEPWTRLQSWLTSPMPGDTSAAIAYLVGMSFVFLLVAMRHRLPWFPFHPGGYIVSGAYAVPRHWVPIFSTWLIKACLLRYGGITAYRATLPFFMGLIIGEFTTGFLRTIIGLALKWDMPPASGIGGL